MRPLTLLLVLVLVAVSATAVHARPVTADNTPAARFWKDALPSSPLPAPIADLIQQGIDHSGVVEHGSTNNPQSSSTLIRYTTLIRYRPQTSNTLIRYRPQTSNTLIRYRPQSTQTPDNKMVPPPASGLFFHQAETRVGTTMKVFFPPAITSPILPRDVAQTLPFKNLTEVLTRFNITPGSSDAATLEETLRWCEAPPTDGEKKACSMSLESTVQSAMDMLSTTTIARHFWAAASAIPRAGLPARSYIVKKVTPLDGDLHVGCHDVPFPYAVYSCHMTGRPTKAYMVSLRGLSGGPTVAMAALCHLDTSDWSPAHPAFEVLHGKPGGAPVCHFMPYANLVFGGKVG